MSSTGPSVEFGKNTRFLDNLCDVRGGAVYCQDPSTVCAFDDNLLFDGNNALQFGGAVVVANGAVMNVGKSAVWKENTAVTNGAAFYIDSSAVLNLDSDGEVINNGPAVEAMDVAKGGVLVMEGNTLVRDKGPVDLSLLSGTTYCQPQAEQYHWEDGCEAASCTTSYAQPAAFPSACSLEDTSPNYGKVANGVVCLPEVALSPSLPDPTVDGCFAACKAKAQLAPSNLYFSFNLAPKTRVCNFGCRLRALVEYRAPFRGITLSEPNLSTMHLLCKRKELGERACAPMCTTTRDLADAQVFAACVPVTATAKAPREVPQGKQLRITRTLAIRGHYPKKAGSFQDMGWAMELPAQVTPMRSKSTQAGVGKKRKAGPVATSNSTLVWHDASFARKRQFTVVLQVDAPRGTTLSIPVSFFQEAVQDKYTPYCTKQAASVDVRVK